MKILVLENDSNLYNGHSFTYWVEDMKKEGHEIKIICNAYSNAEKIIKNINWPDRVAFMTTFVYIYPIYDLMQAIIKARKTPLEIYISSDGVSYNVRRLMEIYSDKPVWKADGKEVDYWENDPEKEEEFAWMIRHLIIKELEYSPWLDEDDNISRKEILKEITFLKELVEQRQRKIDEDKEYIESKMKPEAHTGRYVKIKTFPSNPGKEWSQLKEGSIVPEIDMSDSNDRIQRFKDRGVWIMGLTEPVKILNCYPYDEFEFIFRSIEDLAEEILKKCDKPLTSTNFYLVLGILKEDLSSHWKATIILDEFGLPRRGYRSILEERIEKFEKLNANKQNLQSSDL